MFDKVFLDFLNAGVIPEEVYKRNHILYSLNSELILVKFALETAQRDVAAILIDRIKRELEDKSESLEKYSGFVFSFKRVLASLEEAIGTSP